MSLNYIRKVLTENLNRIKIPEVTDPSNSDYYILENFDEYRDAIQKIKEIGVFKELISQIINTPIYKDYSTRISVNRQNFNSFKSLNDKLINLVSNFLNTIEDITPFEKEGSITIKFPELNNFAEVEKYAHDFQLILSQTIVNDKINGNVEITSVENGSIIFTVFIGLSAVSVIASIVWSASVIFKKMQEGRILKAQADSLQIKNETMEDLRSALEVELKKQTELETEYIYDEFYQGSNLDENEYKQRIQFSIKTLADLIYRGAEIQPALNTSEEVSNLFPKLKDLPLLQSKVKQLNN